MRAVLHVVVRPRDPHQVEGSAHSILAQHQFHHPKSLITRFLDWLGHELEKIFSWRGGGTHDPDDGLDWGAGRCDGRVAARR